MEDDYSYQATKQRLSRSIRAQFGGAEMLNLKQAAQVLGYVDPAKAKPMLKTIPYCEFSPKKHKWAVTDLAGALARRMRAPI